MKKILVLFMLLFSLGGYLQQVEADDSATTDIYLHYYRYNGDYSGWNVWAWQSEPTSLGGFQADFIADETDAEYNYGGMVAVINITEQETEEFFDSITTMGLIIRKGAWAEKDISSDRLIAIPSTSENGEAHFYLVEGDVNIGTSLNDPDGPDRYPKFKTAYFTELNTISFTATEEIASENLIVYADDTEISINSSIIDGNSGTVVLNEDLDFSKEYKIEATFTSDSTVNDYTVTFDGIYDSQEFENEFAYDGELGSIINNDNSTTFRLWAPISQSVTLNLYNTGTKASDGGTDNPIATYEMVSGEKGTFSYTSNENLHGTYYTYSVTNGAVTSEVVDPYTRSTGVNGYRGLVVDFDQVNPDGWTYDNRADNMTDPTDAIIYELHIRDLTSSDTWNGTEANSGKYLGLIEEGTTYEGVTTGFDHLKEIGVTHIQLLPFFDFGVVDETKLDDEEYNSFNWGYMPLNFNALEGSYSSDPYDGLARVSEMKQVVMAFTEADLRINMDVVYNHTGLSADSNFNLIVPGYYYRMTESGGFSNGSGTGNETASERYMMQKFMVDSTVFWATEYNISGFRFDLMALHDVETMELIASTLHDIDSTIMVYGEPWTGGSSPLATEDVAGKANLSEIEGVGAFNDDTRDGIKGSVFQREAGGWVQGDFSFSSKVKYGILGGVEYPGIAYGEWHTEPYKTINYVACHDNNTLYDKLYLTLEEDEELEYLLDMAKQSYGIILTSQGIPFIHAGDEFLRSKPAENGLGFDHNSYESPDSVNSIDWSLKVSEDGAEMYSYIKGLIELRLEHSSFTMTNSTEIIDNLDFLYKSYRGILAYNLNNADNGDSAEDILVIHNGNKEAVELALPLGGGWIVTVDGETAGDTELARYFGGEVISIEANSTYVLQYDATIEAEGLEMLETEAGVTAYTVTDTENEDIKVMYLENTTEEDVTFELPKGNGWTVTLDEDTEPTVFYGGDEITIPAGSVLLLNFDAELASTNITVIILSIVGGIIAITAGVILVLPHIKKK